MESALWSAEAIKVEAEPLPGVKDEGSPTDERASSAPVVAGESVPADEIVERPEERSPVAKRIIPLQPPRSVALYIDGDNQSPAIARDLLASVRQDLGLEVSRVVLAGNDHGHTVPRWQAALAKEALSEDRIVALCVPKKPEAADLALILELGAAMERHRQGPDLVVIVSRDEWLIGAAEAVRARGCRVWVAYAENDAVPAQTPLPTLLLPAINRAQAQVRAATAGVKTPTERTLPTVSTSTVPSTPAAPTAKPTAAAPAVQPTPSHTKLLAQVRAQCQVQPGGGYLATEVGQVLYTLGLTDKAARTRFLKAIDGLQEAGAGGAKRLIF
ncbi:NYN domain-containing protein [Allochromatium palmeri]|uniref:NYN domain-containing protein n=2 Tax=Allochromatium palmeri TaxID=231048 RepID=A0A6N8EJE7_9GAMM|nr:NYN domain-containing protein [Allochromatium palmeri]